MVGIACRISRRSLTSTIRYITGPTSCNPRRDVSIKESMSALLLYSLIVRRTMDV
jgi:hypothetical protein